MKTIIIGFSHPAKFSLHAWLIEKIDGAPFDHAYLRFHSDNLDRDIIYQSNWRGVQFIGAILWSQTTTPVQEFSLQVPDDRYNKMMQFCVDNAGINYGYLGVLGQGIRNLAAKIGWNINNPFNQSQSTEFCSQIVTNCLNVADPSQFNLNADNISPKNLNDILIQLKIPQVS